MRQAGKLTVCYEEDNSRRGGDEPYESPKCERIAEEESSEHDGVDVGTDGDQGHIQSIRRSSRGVNDGLTYGQPKKGRHGKIAEMPTNYRASLHNGRSTKGSRITTAIAERRTTMVTGALYWRVSAPR